MAEMSDPEEEIDLKMVSLESKAQTAANIQDFYFLKYWTAMKMLVGIMIERKQSSESKSSESILTDELVKQAKTTTKNVNSIFEDRLFTEDELEDEADSTLKGMTLVELKDFQAEIRQSIVMNQAFSSDLHYWQNLLQKVKCREAILQIEMIYDKYIVDNKADVDHQIELATLSEAAKNVAIGEHDGQ